MKENQVKLLNTQETATYLNLKISRIRNLVFMKKIPFIKIGATIRFNQGDLDIWLIQRTQPYEET